MKTQILKFFKISLSLKKKQLNNMQYMLIMVIKINFNQIKL